MLDDAAHQHTVLSMLEAEGSQRDGAVVPVQLALGRLQQASDDAVSKTTQPRPTRLS